MGPPSRDTYRSFPHPGGDLSPPSYRPEGQLEREGRGAGGGGDRWSRTTAMLVLAGQCHHAAVTCARPCAGLGTDDSDSGTTGGRRTVGQHLPRWLCRRSRGFPTSCTNPGSVIHRRTFVTGADGGGQLGDKVGHRPVPLRPDQRPSRELKGEQTATVRGRYPLARDGQQMWGKQELSAQIQP